MLEHRKKIILGFAVLCLLSLISLPRLKINFEFEQFFPEGDEDLEFFKSFTSEFENDDNFLFLALKAPQSIFDTTFLKRVHEVTLESRKLPYVATSQSITSSKYPVKTPFGYSLIPMVHLQDATKLKIDSLNLIQDERVMGYLVSKGIDAASIIIKTKNNINVSQSDSLLSELKLLLDQKGFAYEDVHLLGRAFFQSELVALQKKEVLISTFVSAILVAVILWIIFASWWSVLICITGVTASLLIFMGFLSLTGRELTLMSALYPVLILIVGSSDVIHLMTKYIDSNAADHERIRVMKAIIREIGFATFLTSVTTAVGFVTLITSRLSVIRDFGVNAGIGVMIAFVVVLAIVPGLLLFFKPEQLYKQKGKAGLLQAFANHAYHFSLNHAGRTVWIFIIGTLICIAGLTQITTNYKLIDNLPRGAKVTNDFLYFEFNFSGFRPLEFAISTNAPYRADDFEVIKEIDKLESYLRSSGAVNSSLSQAMLYKSMSMMSNGNQKAYYKMPETKEEFMAYKSLISKMRTAEATVLVNKDNNKTRISAIVADIGADSIKHLGTKIDAWVGANIDKNIMAVRRTGTGLILDKNSIYVTESLLKGLLLSVIFISLLMAFLVKNARMWLITLVPNILPLAFAGALLGFLNIELEAGISIIFAVIFGIAVDDTIHFISRFNLCIKEGLDVESAIAQTFQDTGKALVLTTVILFFGFLVMLFSAHPPSVIVGVLISITLISTLLCDLYLLPLLLRKFIKLKGK
ncbi:MAG: MMPL family transporter [Saprospiraceae bacterium]|nr:MMPL family transporter [Saprospiraceae bacterium]